MLFIINMDNQLRIRGNFLGAAVVCVINLVLVDISALSSFRTLPRASFLLINVILDFLIILLMHFAFKNPKDKK